MARLMPLLHRNADWKWFKVIQSAHIKEDVGYVHTFLNKLFSKQQNPVL